MLRCITIYYNKLQYVNNMFTIYYNMFTILQYFYNILQCITIYYNILKGFTICNNLCYKIFLLYYVI